jgi:hypothetical protein
MFSVGGIFVVAGGEYNEISPVPFECEFSPSSDLT